ncbi:MAG TPA: tRNA glutamyl-Q(34) synthetase GluQRS [Sulfitobacter sp.]|nr:tRNA glutamyl-Q(34) synthetase GluQRS [Sulfitobacter sp.]
MTLTTRFAPSPTGPLHLGHAYSALLAHDLAKAAGGRFLLRIEDIDQSRARPKWEAQIYEDLAWLGIDWPQPVMRQSDRMAAYRSALDDLWARGLLYACTCNRRDIAAATSAPQEGAEPVYGPDGLIYPGTCRNAGHPKASGALRLDMRKALAFLGNRALSFTENGYGPNVETGAITFSPDQLIATVGDVVLARRDMGTSYHLSVVLDDAAQGITLVPRGADLFEATYIHVVLQALLDLPTPHYHHHRLIRDDGGKRLAKRDDARAIALYRENGMTPEDILSMVGL